MKRIMIFTGLFLLSFYNTFSQTHVVESTVRAAGYKTVASLSGLPVDSANRTVRYLDGLGRLSNLEEEFLAKA